MTTISNSSFNVETIMEFEPYNPSHTTAILKQRAEFLYSSIKNNEVEIVLDSPHRACLQYQIRKWMMERTEILKLLQMKYFPRLSTAPTLKRKVDTFFKAEYHFAGEEHPQKKVKLIPYVCTFIKVEDV
jgi:hypothetical protein